MVRGGQLSKVDWYGLFLLRALLPAVGRVPLSRVRDSQAMGRLRERAKTTAEELAERAEHRRRERELHRVKKRPAPRAAAPSRASRA